MDPLRPLLRLLAPLWAHRFWPRVRLLLILLHLTAVASVACPAPVRAASKKQWDKPSVKVEIRGWHQRLNAIGINITETELRDWAFDASREWSSARNAAVAPFSAYLKKIGAPQGWYMFTAPDRHPQRFALEVVHDDGRVEPIFTLGQSVARPDLVDPSFLGEHRVRRALFQTSWSERPTLYKDVCAWFARRLEAPLPTLKEARCSQIQLQVEHPWKTEKKVPEKSTRTVRVPRAEGKPEPTTIAVPP